MANMPRSYSPGIKSNFFLKHWFYKSITYWFNKKLIFINVTFKALEKKNKERNAANNAATTTNNYSKTRLKNGLVNKDNFSYSNLNPILSYSYTKKWEKHQSKNKFY